MRHKRLRVENGTKGSAIRRKSIIVGIGISDPILSERLRKELRAMKDGNDGLSVLTRKSTAKRRETLEDKTRFRGKNRYESTGKSMVLRDIANDFDICGQHYKLEKISKKEYAPNPDRTGKLQT
ncbi:uncharacterized protein KY384_007216 [Bacidia gigantensis]|uniref:uncharacterized protein n=1 Tax=Bacidia gigantensis TaxID=2732470 RepID=UPI001D045F73|nr:uncharacterized protein KY384_007216 [Bacidia gigantensis]KAG8528299.1 hypothetical protein KY384_007216 [Bacidia gigantensis]